MTGGGQRDTSGLPPHLPLKTRWAKDVSPEHVLPEYPRPQLVRPRWSNLNGAWDHAIRDSGDVIDHHPYPDPKLDHLEPHRAAVISEFGGLGYTVPGHMWRESDWSYDQKQTARELGEGYRHLIQEARALEDKGLAAAVYTQWTDVEAAPAP